MSQVTENGHVDLLWSANLLAQYLSGRQVFRGTAMLRLTPRGISDRSPFETVSEIRIGATEADLTGSGMV
jgi:hypothetical protein